MVRRPDCAVGCDRQWPRHPRRADPGRDFAYIGSAFIATAEANAVEGYKQMITSAAAEDIVYSNCSPAYTAIT